MTDTNSTELVYARQVGFKQGLNNPPNFRILERSELSQFGNTTTKSEPTRISKNRNTRKKRVTSVDSGVEVKVPLDFDGLLEFGQAFTYGKPTGPAYFAATAATANGATVSPVTAEQAAMLKNGASGTTILRLLGFATKETDGEHLLSGAVAENDVNIDISGLTAETIADDRRGVVFIAGVRGAAGDLEIDADGHLISTALDLSTLGLVVDQAIYIGGTDELNRFNETENAGFAQIKTIAANKLELYNRDNPYVLDDGGTVQVDILFGPLLRNYPVDSPNFQRLFYTFGLSTEFTDPVKTTYEYAEDNGCDSMSFSVFDEFASITLGFVGTLTTKPSITAASGHSNAAPLNATAEFSSSVDLVQIGIKDEDGSNLLTDFDDMTITIANGATARKVGGTVKAGQINISKFRTTFDFTAMFSNSDIIERIQCDREMNLRFPMWNDDGGFYFHIPKLGLEGGDRSYPENESVMISATGYAYNEDKDGACVSISLFPLLPKRPCVVG